MSTLIIVVILIYVIFFAFSFLSYAFNSYGLYEIAKRENEDKQVLAWIPYLNKFTLGRLAFKSNIHGILLVTFNIIGLICLLALLFISKNEKAIIAFSLISIVMFIITSIYSYFARYKLYKRYGKSTILLTVLDVISCGILGPFFVFAIRNNNEN